MDWWIIMDCLDCHGLWTSMDYCRLKGLIIDYTIMDYSYHCDTLWMFVDYRGFLNVHHHGIAWITRSAPQASEDT